MASTTSSTVHQLRWNDEGVVMVTPEDEDRFSVKIHRAIEVLRQASHADEFKRQFSLLLRLLAGWLKARSDIDRAYLTHRDGVLMFVVLRTSCEYDDDFEDALSSLDFSVANDADLDKIKMDAITLPPASESAISSFLAPDFVIEYTSHGDRSGSHSSGE